jgi:hypothetical protein
MFSKRPNFIPLNLLSLRKMHLNLIKLALRKLGLPPALKDLNDHIYVYIIFQVLIYILMKLDMKYFRFTRVVTEQVGSGDNASESYS